MYKIASANTSEGREVVSGIMRRIYAETPEYWPYGLDISGHDDVYLIREKQSNIPAGFVGWQTGYEKEDGRLKKIGYYSIGILPEFRKKGFAKEAVARILRIKAAGYDRVQAFIVEKNSPSIALANSLSIPVVHKVAAVKQSAEGGKGCLMAYLPTIDAVKVLAWTMKMIPERFLSNEGYERSPHVTVLYGFPPDTAEDDIAAFLKDTGPVSFTLGKVTRFLADEDNPDRDVIKVSVESKDLDSLHASLKERFKVETTYPDYTPHLTLAYVQPDVLRQKLDHHARFNKEVYVVGELVYSRPGNERHTRFMLGEAGEDVTKRRA